MLQANTKPMKITKVETSKIDKVDFSNLPFGSVFTDHMVICDFKNGDWNEPYIKPYSELPLQPSARVFHYGQAVFEGMKAYKDADGKIWMFRPLDNFYRINKSAARLAMPELPKEYFFQSLEELLKLESDWIKPGKGNSLYIRPFMIATDPMIAASPGEEYKFIVICSPAQSYYAGKVKVMIAQKYSRAADGGVGFAKAAGNYASQFYPTNLAKQKGFQQVIWTDANSHQFLEEAGTMNIFFRIGDKLVTAPTNDRILDGVTRKSVLQIAQDKGIECEVRPVKVAEIIEAAENNNLLEVFGTGTAAVISEVSAVGFKDKVYDLPELANDYASVIKNAIFDIQYNEAADPYGWRYAVE